MTPEELSDWFPKCADGEQERYYLPERATPLKRMTLGGGDRDSTVKSTHMRGIAFLVLGLAALAAALLTTQFHFLGVAIAVIAFFLGGTAFSHAGQLATSLRPFVKRSVRVQVWGTPLQTTNGAPFEIDSIKAVGVGLLIYLRPGSGGPRSLLKVAQPRSARLEDGGIEIGEARYVSWGGTRLKPVVGHPALALLTTS